MKHLISLLRRTDLTEQEIFRTEDAIGPVVVLQKGDLRILSFESHLDQSVMNTGNPLVLVHEYLRVMLIVLAFKHPKHITILGLGGGSLLRVIHRYDPAMQIDVVELRESVIRIAKDYFGLPSGDQIHIHHHHSFTYLSNAARQTSDIIFADMYLDQDMDAFQGSISFINHCRELLTDDGWLVINFLQLPDFEHPYTLKLAECFAEILYFGTGKGNFVMLCGKRSLEKALPDYRNDIIALERHFDVALTCYFDCAIRINLSTTD